MGEEILELPESHLVLRGLKLNMAGGSLEVEIRFYCLWLFAFGYVDFLCLLRGDILYFECFWT